MKVVAVAETEAVREQLLAQLSAMAFIDVCGVVIDLPDANKLMQTHNPDVLIMDLSGRELDACLFIEVINYQVTNKTLVFGLHRDVDPQVIMKAVSSGAKEFIHYPEDADALRAALEKHWQFRLKVLQSQSDADPAHPQARLIPVFGAKGGTGTTTIAVNLAQQIRQLTQQPVLLWDLDPLFGNTAVMLGIKPQYALSDLMGEDVRNIDDALIEKIIHSHDESGLDLLVCSKHVLDDNPGITEALLARVISTVSQGYAYVVIDMPTHVVDPIHQYFVGMADIVLLVSAMEIASLYRSRQYLELVRHHLENESEKVRLILNRYDLKAAVGMSNDALEAEFNYPVYSRLPNNWTLTLEAMSLGKTLAAISPQADLVQAFQSLAANLTGTAQTIAEAGEKSTAKRSGLKSLFTRRAPHAAS